MQEIKNKLYEIVLIIASEIFIYMMCWLAFDGHCFVSCDGVHTLEMPKMVFDPFCDKALLLEVKLLAILCLLCKIFFFFFQVVCYVLDLDFCFE